ncbi:hypothetical protein LINPERHAP2_LOCUS9725 [Linum perenne]
MHFITGLTVDGLAVTSAIPIPSGTVELQDYTRPPTADLSSGRIKISWLRNNFSYRGVPLVMTIL